MSTRWPTFCARLRTKTVSVTLFNSAFVFDERFCLDCISQGGWGASVANAVHTLSVPPIGRGLRQSGCVFLSVCNEWPKHLVFSWRCRSAGLWMVTPVISTIKTNKASLCRWHFIVNEKASEWQRYEITSLKWMMRVRWCVLLLHSHIHYAPKYPLGRWASSFSGLGLYIISWRRLAAQTGTSVITNSAITALFREIGEWALSMSGEITGEGMHHHSPVRPALWANPQPSSRPRGETLPPLRGGKPTAVTFKWNTLE